MPPTDSPQAERPPVVIGYRERKQMGLWPLLLLSIALHAILALVVAYVLSRHFAKEAPDQLDLGIDVTLGEAVQELVVTQPSTNNAPPDPTPPEPPKPPDPEPPKPPDPEPPPVVEKPEFAEPKPEPKVEAKPQKREQPKSSPAKAAGAPPGAKVGPVARAGVVGGNVTQGATTGTPGGQKVGNQGWRTPKPPYPPSALASHVQASGSARITTDASGNVTSCEVMGLPSPLDSNTRSFARENWKGPPNATRSVPVIYRIP